jgi:hypothetical protein
MATPRHLLVDPVNECDYHLVSRCVRRAFLCGVDDYDDRDHSHRRAWLVDRMRQLAPCFAVDVYAHTILDNHFHLVLRHDPLAHRDWTDDEVAWRWFEAFPPSRRGAVAEELKPERRELMLGDPERLARARRTLGSMSDFMKHLKQPVARRANLEDDRTGHFFEQRFYSGALLTGEALVAAMAYVDLNPVRAKLAERIEEIRDTSICDRLLENSAEALADYLRPVLSGLDRRPAEHDATPGVVATVGSPVVASADTPVPRDAASERRPERDAEEPDPGHPCGADTESGRCEPRRNVCGARAGPRGAPRAPARTAAPPRHAGGVHRTRPRHGRGGERARRQCPGRGQALAGADQGARQAAARVRQRVRAAAVDRRPGPAASGDPPARLTAGGRRRLPVFNRSLPGPAGPTQYPLLSRPGRHIPTGQHCGGPVPAATASRSDFALGSVQGVGTESRVSANPYERLPARLFKRINTPPVTTILTPTNIGARIQTNHADESKPNPFASR